MRIRIGSMVIKDPATGKLQSAISFKDWDCDWARGILFNSEYFWYLALLKAGRVPKSTPQKDQENLDGFSNYL